MNSVPIVEPGMLMPSLVDNVVELVVRNVALVVGLVAVGSTCACTGGCPSNVTVGSSVHGRRVVPNPVDVVMLSRPMRHMVGAPSTTHTRYTFEYPPVVRHTSASRSVTLAWPSGSQNPWKCSVVSAFTILQPSAVSHLRSPKLAPEHESNIIICSCGLPRRCLRVGEASMGMASGMEVGAAVCTDSTVAVGGDVVSAGGRAWGGTRGGVAEASAAAGLGRAVRAGVGGVGAPMGTQPLYPAGPAASASAARAADSAVAASMNSCRGVVGFGAVVGGVPRGRLALGRGAVVVGVPRGGGVSCLLIGGRGCG